MKKLLNISFLILLLVALIVLPAFTDLEHLRKTYQSFTVEILNPSDRAMITQDEIRNLVKKNFGEIEGSPTSVIDLIKLEKIILDNPYVSACEVYKTMDCDLVLKARVRVPLVRIINENDEQFYLDLTGCAMPLNPAHPSLVPIANGKIADHYMSLDKTEKSLGSFPASSVLQQIYPVAYYLSKDEFLNSFIDQIYIHENLEMELIPKMGSQVILFGNAEDAREKLENLKIFYKKVMRRIDWNEYKTINLKYKNQVVCLKNMNYE
jgi:cell division protein FtsQ